MRRDQALHLATAVYRARSEPSASEASGVSGLPWIDATVPPYVQMAPRDGRPKGARLLRASRADARNALRARYTAVAIWHGPLGRWRARLTPMAVGGMGGTGRGSTPPQPRNAQRPTCHVSAASVLCRLVAHLPAHSASLAYARLASCAAICVSLCEQAFGGSGVVTSPKGYGELWPPLPAPAAVRKLTAAGFGRGSDCVESLGV